MKSTLVGKPCLHALPWLHAANIFALCAYALHAYFYELLLCEHIFHVWLSRTLLQRHCVVLWWTFISRKCTKANGRMDGNGSAQVGNGMPAIHYICTALAFIYILVYTLTHISVGIYSWKKANAYLKELCYKQIKHKPAVKV